MTTELAVAIIGGLVTAIAGGGGLFAWLSSRKKTWIEGSQAYITSLEQRIERLVRAGDAKDHQLDEWKARYFDLEGRYNAELSENLKKIHALEFQVQQLQQRTEAIQAECAEDRRELEELKARIYSNPEDLR